MKRDVDLIRQLLFEIERQGAECSLDALRNGAGPEMDERLRYHLRLIIDAGLAKEFDRAAPGQPCVRLTNAGHELLELCRGDTRWREAKWIVQQQTGGLSLTVLRAVLTKWAVERIAPDQRPRRRRRAYRPYYGPVYYREAPIYAPGYRVESYRYGREPAFDDEAARLVRPRREYREAAIHPERWEQARGAIDDTLADEPLGISLPVHMI